MTERVTTRPGTDEATGKDRSEMSESLIDDELAILTGAKDAEHLDAVAELAQQEWAALYPDTRMTSMREERLDKGISRSSASSSSRTTAALTEQQWIRQRRANADKIAAAARGTAERPLLSST